MTAPDEWFSSSRPATIGDRAILLKANPQLPHTPLVISKGQAACYPASATDGTQWLLKSFLPAKKPQADYIAATANCIPQSSTFRSGWERSILSKQSLTKANGCYWSKELGAWLNGVILMPRLQGDQWGSILNDLVDDAMQLDAMGRIAIARQLAGAILRLELAEVSHRDLSPGNILVDIPHGEIHLIDWDSLYHPKLQFQPNTTMGTEGYMAPWIQESEASWCFGADRFALAICIGEILTVRSGDELRGDGSWFRQSDIGHNNARYIDMRDRLRDIAGDLEDLFVATWNASAFDVCPSPADWLVALPQIATAGVWHARLVEQADLDGLAKDLIKLRVVIRNKTEIEASWLSRLNPQCLQLLTSAERNVLDQLLVADTMLQTLRDALRQKDDATVVQIAQSPGFQHLSLRRSELLEVQWAQDRLEMLIALEDAVQRGDDAATRDAWWKLTMLQGDVPVTLAQTARAASERLSQLRSTPPPKQPVKALPPKIPVQTAPQLPEAAIAQVEYMTAVKNAERAVSMEVKSSTRYRIVAAARTARDAGAYLSPHIWDLLVETEEQTDLLQQFKQALRRQQVAESAALWARIKANWPDLLNPNDDAAGRTAFQAWGKSLHADDQQRP